MYRDPDLTPRCTSCGGTELTGPTKCEPSEGSLAIHFQVSGAAPGFLGEVKTERFVVDRARVCLACGHVMLALYSTQLASLRRQLGKLGSMG